MHNIQTHVSCIREILRTNKMTFLEGIFHSGDRTDYNICANFIKFSYITHQVVFTKKLKKATHRNTLVTDYTGQANCQDYVKNSLINEYADYGDIENYGQSSFTTR